MRQGLLSPSGPLRVLGAGPPCLQRVQASLQAVLEGATYGHRFTQAFHLVIGTGMETEKIFPVIIPWLVSKRDWTVQVLILLSNVLNRLVAVAIISKRSAASFSTICATGISIVCPGLLNCDKSAL